MFVSKGGVMMTKEDIIKKSMKLINKVGLENFSVRKLAKKMDCQPSSLYNHFASKEDLLNQIYMYVHNRYLDNVIGESASLEDMLYKSFKHVVSYPDELIFSRKNRMANFLTKENIKKLEHDREVKMGHLQGYFKQDTDPMTTYIIISGILFELANSSKKMKIDDDNIKTLVKKVALAIEGE